MDQNKPAYHREREARLRTAGLCGLCGATPVGPGGRVCEACRARVKRQRISRHEKLTRSGLCVHCKEPVIPGTRWCEGCRQYRVDRRARLAREGRCVICNKADSLPDRRYCAPCQEKYLSWQKASRLSLRLEIFGHYGMACAHCEESRFEALSIDHVNGGGNAHRRLIGAMTSNMALYRWLKSQGFPPGFQTLCVLCNILKGRRPESDLPPSIRQ